MSKTTDETEVEYVKVSSSELKVLANLMASERLPEIIEVIAPLLTGHSVVSPDVTAIRIGAMIGQIAHEASMPAPYLDHFLKGIVSTTLGIAEMTEETKFGETRRAEIRTAGDGVSFTDIGSTSRLN